MWQLKVNAKACLKNQTLQPSVALWQIDARMCIYCENSQTLSIPPMHCPEHAGVCRPPDEPYVPGGHGMVAEEPNGQYEPGEHGVGVDAPATQK